MPMRWWPQTPPFVPGKLMMATLLVVLALTASTPTTTTSYEEPRLWNTSRVAVAQGRVHASGRFRQVEFVSSTMLFAVGSASGCLYRNRLAGDFSQVDRIDAGFACRVRRFQVVHHGLALLVWAWSTQTDGTSSQWTTTLWVSTTANAVLSSDITFVEAQGWPREGIRPQGRGQWEPWTTLYPHPQRKLAGHLVSIRESVLLKSCEETGHTSCVRSALYHSDDFGKHWKAVRDNVVDVAWISLDDAQADGGQDSEDGENQDPAHSLLDWLFPTPQSSRLWALVENPAVPREQRVRRQLLLLDDFGSQEVLSRPNVLAFAIAGSILYVLEYEDATAGSVLRVSHDGGRTFDQTRFPSEEPRLSMTTLFGTMRIHRLRDRPEKASVGGVPTVGVMIFVQRVPNSMAHQEKSPRVVEDVYISGENGVQFSLSIMDVVPGSFSSVNSASGTYLLNAFDDAGFVHSLITFNNGGVWQRLQVSSPLESFGERGGLTPIHLYRPGSGRRLEELPLGSSLELVPTRPDNHVGYSLDFSVGYILATAFYRAKYWEREGEPSVWLSSDGGLSWFQIRETPRFPSYAMGDAGSLIVVANNNSSEIIFSWSGGMAWGKISPGEIDFQVQGILPEQDAAGNRFIAYGYSSRPDGLENGIVLDLDFSLLRLRPCELPVDNLDRLPPCLGSVREINNGLADNDSHDPDYCLFQPELMLGWCPLGRRESLVRRKRGVICDHRDEMLRWLDTRSSDRLNQCRCNASNYQCDVDYSRASSIALSSDPNHPSGRSPDLTCYNAASNARAFCAGRFFGTQGYRFAPGTSCILKDGINLLPTTQPCNESQAITVLSHFSGTVASVIGYALQLLLLFFFVILILGWIRTRGSADPPKVISAAFDVGVSIFLAIQAAGWLVWNSIRLVGGWILSWFRSKDMETQFPRNRSSETREWTSGLYSSVASSPSRRSRVIDIPDPEDPPRAFLRPP